MRPIDELAELLLQALALPDPEEIETKKPDRAPRARGAGSRPLKASFLKGTR